MTIDDHRTAVSVVGAGFSDWLGTFYRYSDPRDHDGPGPDTLARWYLADVDPVDAYVRLRLWPRFFGYDPPAPPVVEDVLPPDLPAWQRC